MPVFTTQAGATPKTEKLLWCWRHTTIIIHFVFSNLAKKACQTKEVTSFERISFLARLL
jgi:hypothetical protein